MTDFERAIDNLECAFIRLHGATERLFLILNHRSVRNYEMAIKSLESAVAEFREAKERTSAAGMLAAAMDDRSVGEADSAAP